MVIFVLWLFVVLPFAKGNSIPFRDCGSDGIAIETVELPGCDRMPCEIHRGFAYHLYVTPDYLAPEVDQINIDASVFVFGAHLPVEAECENPCVYACPLTYGLERPRLDITVNFGPSLISLRSQLYVNATYTYRGRIRSRMCMRISIDLY